MKSNYFKKKHWLELLCSNSIYKFLLQSRII